MALTRAGAGGGGGEEQQAAFSGGSLYIIMITISLCDHDGGGYETTDAFHQPVIPTSTLPKGANKL